MSNASNIKVNSPPFALWLWQDYDQLPDSQFDQYQQCFSDSEKQRVKRIRSESRLREYIAGHYMLRTMLKSLYLESLDNDGIEHPDKRPPRFSDSSIDLYFNITHSHGLIMCSVSRVGEIGIDIETPRRTASLNEIAASYFAPQESELIHRLDAGQAAVEFYRLWTLKESLLKATQEGLSSKGMQIEFSNTPPKALSKWHSYSFTYQTHHGAITLTHPLGECVAVSVYEKDMVGGHQISLPLQACFPNLNDKV